MVLQRRGSAERGVGAVQLVLTERLGKREQARVSPRSGGHDPRAGVASLPRGGGERGSSTT